MPNWPLKSTADPPGKVTDTSFCTGLTFRWGCQRNSQIITCSLWLNSNLKVQKTLCTWGLLQVNASTNKSDQSQFHGTGSNCLFVTINLELWLQTPDIDIEFLVIPCMKNGAQSEGLVCVFNGRLESGGRPEWFPQRNWSDVEAQS